MQGNPNPSPSTRWKPGQSGNPTGQHIVSKEVLRMQRLTKEELATCASWLVKGNKDDLARIVNDPNSSIISVMIASLAIRAISKGDFLTFNAILDRVVGKPKEMVELSGKDGGPIVTQRVTEQDLRAIRELAEESARIKALSGIPKPVDVDSKPDNEG
jgi:hypothetical protein